MQCQYLYLNMGEFNTDRDGEQDNNETYSFKTREPETLGKLLKALKDNTSISIDQFKIDNNIKKEELINHLTLYCMINNIIEVKLYKVDNKDKELTKVELEDYLKRIELKLGLKIVYFLEKINIIEIFVNNRKVPFINFFINYFMRLNYQKICYDNYQSYIK